MAISPPAVSVIIALVVVIPIIFLRMKRIRSGTKISISRTIAFSTVLLSLSIFFLVNSFSIGVPHWYSFVYAASFAVLWYGSYRYSDRVLQFWETADGSIYAKGGTALFIFYIVSIAARIGVASLVGGSQAFVMTTRSLLAPNEAIVASTVLDGSLISGIALLIGRNSRILARYLKIKRRQESVRRLTRLLVDFEKLEVCQERESLLF